MSYIEFERPCQIGLTDFKVGFIEKMQLLKLKLISQIQFLWGLNNIDRMMEHRTMGDPMVKPQQVENEWWA